MIKQKCIWIHFNKKQHHSGFLIYRKDGLSFEALVLPKMWRWKESKDPVNVFQVEYDINSDESDITLIVYEGDRYCFNCDETWANFFEEMASQVFDAEAKHDKSEDLESTLFDKVSGFKDWKLNKVLKRSPLTKNSNEAFEKEFSSFFNLLLFSKKLNLKERSQRSAQDGFGFQIGEGNHKDPLLNLCVSQILVNEIETHLKRIRLGYLRITEKRNVIKGKLTGRSIGELMMTDTQVAECVYDKFVSDIPLFRVFVTALERIASGSYFPVCISSVKFAQSIQRKAHLLRVELSHIRSYPISVAAHHSRRLKLLRRDIIWKNTLMMSKILLNNLPKDMKDSEQGSGGFIWKVDTAKVWENILKQILEEAGFTVTEQGGKENQFLWKNSGDKLQPDLIADREDCSYLFDAKYKTDKGNVPKTPSDNDRYQLFAYSHLFDKNNVGILYPAKSFESLEQVGDAYKRGDSENCLLRCYQIPFPNFDEVKSMTAWHNYCSDKAKRFNQKMQSTNQK